MTVEVKPSELPRNTVINDAVEGRWEKGEYGLWYLMTPHCSECIEVASNTAFALQADALITKYAYKHHTVPADAFFKNFEILSTPVGWKPNE